MQADSPAADSAVLPQVKDDTLLLCWFCFDDHATYLVCLVAFPYRCVIIVMIRSTGIH